MMNLTSLMSIVENLLSERTHLPLHPDSAVPIDEDRQGTTIEADIKGTGIRRLGKVQQVSKAADTGAR